MKTKRRSVSSLYFSFFSSLPLCASFSTFLAIIFIYLSNLKVMHSFLLRLSSCPLLSLSYSSLFFFGIVASSQQAGFPSSREASNPYKVEFICDFTSSAYHYLQQLRYSMDKLSKKDRILLEKAVAARAVKDRSLAVKVTMKHDLIHTTATRHPYWIIVTSSCY